MQELLLKINTGQSVFTPETEATSLEGFQFIADNLLGLYCQDYINQYKACREHRSGKSMIDQVEVGSLTRAGARQLN